MSNFLKRWATFLSLVFMVAANAGAAQESTAEYDVDTVSMPAGVRQFSIDSKTGNLLVTSPTNVVMLETFPLRVLANFDLTVDGISSALTSDGTLVVLGENTSAKNGGGMLQMYPNIANAGEVSKEPLGTSLGTTPYTQALMSDNDVLYAVNPTSLSVMQVSVDNFLSILRQEDVQEERNLSEQLKLRCGPASSISVFDFAQDGKDPLRFYFASVTGKKELEIGRERTGRYAFTDNTCFKPAGAIRSKSKSTRAIGRQSLLHALIDNQWYGYDPEQPQRWVITFDPDAHVLTLFPIRVEDGKVALRRSEGQSTNLIEVFDKTGLPRGQFGLLAASDGASVVLVSHIGSNHVHRLKRVETELEYVGQTTVPGPIRKLEVSDDGRIAAVLLQDPEDEKTETIALIRNPADIDGSGDLPSNLFSVLEIQKILSQQGLSLRLDGILGDQTKAAIKAFYNEPATEQSVATTSETETPDWRRIVKDRMDGLSPVAHFGPTR